MYIKKYYIIFCFVFIGLYAASQNNSSYLIKNYNINPEDTNKLFLQIDNVNFIKNYEYFGSIAEGYTLLGFNISPTFVYIPDSKIKLRLGGNFLSYYGRENELEASLLASLQYKINPNLHFILGNIYGTLNHKLIGPLLSFERYLNNNVENGIQFIWDSDRIFTDLWLDWEQQIFQDDPFQEKFNVGLSSEFIIFKKSDQYSFSIPFQNLIRHEGGQINSNRNEPLTTIFNNATGLSFSRNIQNKLIHKFNFTAYIVNYQDLSPTKRQMYIDGTASYSTFTLANNNFYFLFGYWYGKQYIAPIGNPIFETYSRTNFYVEEPIRQLITGNFNYQKDILDGINLGIRLETFYDIPGKNFEYAWAVIVVFDKRFFLKEF